MTVAIIPAKARRAGVVLGAVSAGLLVLSACDKPTPLATVTVGSGSVHTEAGCYNDGKALPNSEAQSCLSKKADHTISVGPDDTIGFGVDPALTDNHNGWALFLNGQQAEQKPSTATYRPIPAASFFQADQTTGQTPKSVQVAIVETNTKTPSVRGIWHFELKMKTSD
ncbi:DUF2771 domain-containing protein [Streptomyces sp. 8L]|uniref:DUF2771 domain-containing protein n=1 Tax=unclassified Streptomyces TaxID=2593676 RepID=UPI001CD41BAF|nr:DUF2771 domain-containing protein [Streptomyces sp. 8L]MCA1224095.1 DUF2771 domain-containing protein [Streptomyces sp. 8L]